MLAQDDNFQSSLVPKNKVARFLNDALKIHDSQRRLQAAIREASDHQLESTLKEVQSRRTKLNKMIITWRQQQKSLAPKLGDKVAAQAAASPAVQIEHEKLFIPADLTASERLELDLVDLGVEEVRWREGQAFDALRAVQNVVRAATTLYDRKDKNERQQKDNSRAGDHIQDTIKRLSQSEMEEWTNEGDRVQWFRAEAEMQRWQEQKEQKLVELLRAIRSFVKMQSVWSQLGESQANQPGHAAYARQKAWMYERRAEDARNLVRLGGYQALLSPTANVIEFIEGERMKEEQYLSGRLST
ncbi:hypothetical protein DFH09DRAFT_1477218 [Mycena vulgaris]|nr:hypothetical protein DFH09DRAFT_1477218 [Mycena vulgaris]